MSTAAYTRFLREYLHADREDRRDGIPIELLDDLDATERERAERALLDALDTDPTWIVPGLGRLRAQSALPRLRILLDGERTPSRRAVLALAIWQIARDAAMLDELLALSRMPFAERYVPGVVTPFDMISIIHCLAHLPHPKALARLEELKTSDNYLVAYNADYAIGLRATAYASDAQTP